MKWTKLSKKQKKLFTWWTNKQYDAVIADGAIRSGKTLCMSSSFILWAMNQFDGQNFGMCGKTIESLRRNVVIPLFSALEGICEFEDSISRNCITVRYGGRQNRFYLFGGRDESSYAVIQGITLAGVMFDEAVLQPESFVNQAIARCSVSESKFWFNCNPAHPEHWFKRDWIDKAEEKHALYLHFELDDNLSLDSEIKKRYGTMFTGIFYQRYVLGRWVRAEGLVYPMFSREKHVVDSFQPGAGDAYYISVDYGTVNPFSAGLWAVDRFNGKAVRIREFYFDSRREKKMMTDEEYYGEVCKLAGNIPVTHIIADPSAVSFMECIRRHGRFSVRAADNSVENGIRCVASFLESGMLQFTAECRDSIREFGLYSWNLDSRDEKVIKEFDHAMDDIRYFCSTVLKREFKTFNGGIS